MRAGDQNDWKLIVFASAEMVRLNLWINTKNILAAYDLAGQLGLHQIWTCLALQGKMSVL
jgi:uncharacterized protein with NRDE domain